MSILTAKQRQIYKKSLSRLSDADLLARAEIDADIYASTDLAFTQAIRDGDPQKIQVASDKHSKACTLHAISSSALYDRHL